MAFTRDDVILVNEQDEWMGTMNKLQAHQEGALHRAFSVFIINDRSELLLQQRADTKYHSGGLWSNSCCSHPIPLESTFSAANRRINEELGIQCALTAIYKLRYKVDVDNGLIENELDHIFLGYYNGIIAPNEHEVKAVRFLPLDELQRQMEQHPALFTPWLHLALPQFIHHLAEQKKVA